MISLMSDSISRIVGAVRAKAHDSSASGSNTLPDLEQLLREEILRDGVHNSGTPLSDEELRNLAMAELAGFGALQPLLEDSSIEEIWINSPTEVFVARNGVAELTELKFTDIQVRDLVERMLQTSGRRVDMSSPFVDASLPDGSRLHVTIPDITSKHWAVNIRKFSKNVRDLSHLVDSGSLTRQAAEFLRMSVLARQNILVCGATQAGKTTMLNALLRSSRENDRIITVEETFELNFEARDCVAMQCRQASLEGTGEITLRRLIKEALRMRPDRLVVGEVREAESLDLLIALNSGLPGACSLHANSAQDALTKLCTLPLLAGRNIDSSFVVPTVASCIDVVVHCELDRFGRRRVSEIIAPTGRVFDGEIETTVIFHLADDILVATGLAPERLDKFELTNLNPRIILDAA
jgi:pilus assembly protein CpaF